MIKTVKDLITELQKLPPEMLIFDLYEEPFEVITYSDEIYLGDPANPNCQVVEGFILK